MRDSEKKMRAVGVTCGVGSLLIGARQAGFKVEGNVEWRKYYAQPDADGRTTFGENFPGAIYKNKLEQMTEEEFARFSNADIALGHPECGAYSQLSGANKSYRDRMENDAADIPLFVDIIAKLKPRFFVMDDLPKSFTAFPMSEYAAKLSDYDLFPEWISNYHYGNIQKGRKRMFMLGALRSEGWTFRPGEFEHSMTVADTIGDMGVPGRGSNLPNHDPLDETMDCYRALNQGEYRKHHDWTSVKKYFSDKRGGHTLDYVRKDGSMVKRIGFLKGHWHGPAHVLTGGNPTVHAIRNEPYTIRERARIQGFPDDFVFYGTVLNEKGEWTHELNPHMVKQTGKAMPIQFAAFVSKQIMAHINGEPFVASGKRFLDNNEYVDAAKKWYCSNVGYSKQEAACGQCWMRETCTLRFDKYGIADSESRTRDSDLIEV